MNCGFPIVSPLARAPAAVREVGELRRLFESKGGFGLPFPAGSVAANAGRFVDFFARVELQLLRRLSASGADPAQAGEQYKSRTNQLFAHFGADYKVLILWRQQAL